jgi:hypothetical protein
MAPSLPCLHMRLAQCKLPLLPCFCPAYHHSSLLNLTSITSSLLYSLQTLSNQAAGIVTSMLNKLHGQPDSYDKKFVQHCTTTALPLMSQPQSQVQVRQDPRSWNLRYRQRSRVTPRKMRRQDHPEEERQRQRPDGLRRTADAPAPPTPPHCQVLRLVRVQSEMHKRRDT